MNLCLLPAKLALQPEQVLRVRVLPDRLLLRVGEGVQGLAREPAVAVLLLDEELHARDRRLGDGEVRAGSDALDVEGLLELGGVLERGVGEGPELRNGVLREEGVG